LLDLDALRPESIRVRLGGVEHELVPHTLENGQKFHAIQRRFHEQGGDAGAQLGVMEDLLAFIAPTARPHLGGLDPAGQAALIEFWASVGAEDAEKDAAEARVVAADPISPG
jgi:hypothetical protein